MPADRSLQIQHDSRVILIENAMPALIHRAKSLRPGQFKHLIRATSVTSRISERDVMLLWLTPTTRIRTMTVAGFFIDQNGRR